MHVSHLHQTTHYWGKRGRRQFKGFYTYVCSVMREETQTDRNSVMWWSRPAVLRCTIESQFKDLQKCFLSRHEAGQTKAKARLKTRRHPQDQKTKTTTTSKEVGLKNVWRRFKSTWMNLSEPLRSVESSYFRFLCDESKDLKAVFMYFELRKTTQNTPLFLLICLKWAKTVEQDAGNMLFFQKCLRKF